MLLRRLISDPSLAGVSHVLVDEIHERGINEDLLLIILKGVLPRRPDLRIILMSATLNADTFQAYYPGSRAVHIPGFTFPVKITYLEGALALSGQRFRSLEVRRCMAFRLLTVVYPLHTLGYAKYHSRQLLT